MPCQGARAEFLRELEGGKRHLGRWVLLGHVHCPEGRGDSLVPAAAGWHRPSIALTCPLKHLPFPPTPQGPTLSFPRATSPEAA